MQEISYVFYANYFIQNLSKPFVFPPGSDQCKDILIYVSLNISPFGVSMIVHDWQHWPQTENCKYQYEHCTATY